jgi:hypothetical protein
MVQLGFFMHMKLALGAASLRPTRPLLFATAFMLVFSIVIALFKDIPDVKGDAQARTRAPRMVTWNPLLVCLGFQGHPRRQGRCAGAPVHASPACACAWSQRLPTPPVSLCIGLVDEALQCGTVQLRVEALRRCLEGLGNYCVKL